MTTLPTIHHVLGCDLDDRYDLYRFLIELWRSNLRLNLLQSDDQGHWDVQRHGQKMASNTAPYLDLNRILHPYPIDKFPIVLQRHKRIYTLCHEMIPLYFRHDMVHIHVDTGTVFR